MAESLETGMEEYTKDGSVDLRGNPARRSKSGGWTACSFVVVYEVFERMAYYGVSTNLVIYLTTKLHMGTVSSSNNVTNWVGTVWMTPILGAYVADAHLGRYWTFVVSSVIYLSGMCLLVLAVSLPALKPPVCSNIADPSGCEKASRLQLGIFFFALYLLAVGTGGTKPNISTIGADQFDEFDPKEKSHKLSFFNWWMFSIFLGTLFANSVLVYIQDNVGWTVGYTLPTVGLAISIVIFLAGTPFYRHKIPAGSPFTRMTRVIVAAVRKSSVPSPTTQRNSTSSTGRCTPRRPSSESTPPLHSGPLLNKAAVRTGSTSVWSLSTVTQVEETKQILRMIPILFATFIPSAMLAQINTLFIKQGVTLDRRMGPHFKIPAASLTAFVTLSMLVSVVLYDRYFGISLLQRIGVGFVLHIIIMAVASLTERRRLAVARASGVVETGGQVPLTIFVLLPQFVAKIEFFYDQAPESMKSLGTSYAMTTLGVGNFLSSILLSSMASLTRRNGHRGGS
ncbi:unnamed protein product [Spirodela intermedia]|uniref:Uncharacterized protein n=1 Tax=Spirodela intermedia TaxID=51605 RepID=A0A7I8JT58_SPIIN|nr:unnamed protein product [Spirodela intermedia]CAA6673294.1 unnamed protein product [Spirodela intermedia]